MSEGPYKACWTSKETDPFVYGVEGPGRGLGYYAHLGHPENTFPDMESAVKTARMMNLAYEEGRKARSREITALLGLR